MVTGLRFEDQLDGISNYNAWMARIKLVLKENRISKFANTWITPPTDVVQLATHNQKDVKAMCIILDGVKDHLIPHLSRKDTTWKMMEALKGLFQSKNENRKMLPREKLRDTKLTNSHTVTTYLSQVRDELIAIGEKVDDSELVRTALKGFTKQWTTFIKGITAHEKLPNWGWFWDDFVQEELRDGDLHGGQTKNDEKNPAIAVRAKKAKVKKHQDGNTYSRRKKDMSKVECFACQQYGRYARQCSNKKRNGGNGTQAKVVASAKTQVDDFAKKFEEESLFPNILQAPCQLVRDLLIVEPHVT